MHYLIATWLYAAIAPAALAGLLLRRRSARSLAAHAVISTVIHGAAAGLAVAVLYAVLLHGRVGVGQYLVAAYGGIAVMSVLRLLNWGLWRGLERLLVRPAPAGTVGPRRGVALAALLRAVLLLAIGIPYVVSLLLVYRVKSVHEGTPATILQAHYEPVTFTSADGIRLSGWWIPAMRSHLTDGHGPANPGRQTVIFCPGIGADQASQLFLVRDLVPNGYNVLSFDFRGTGQSGGQFSTFGDLERLDVLAAVHWLRQTHPRQSTRIFGLGESTGAAALLAAAADPGPDGQDIDALAVYNPYANLRSEIQSQCTLRGGWGLGFLVAQAALPLAGWQLGTNLADFSPTRAAEQIWPRPLLVIGGTADGVIDFEQSEKVFGNAQPPKYSAWLPKDRQETMHDPNASLDVRIFFAEARTIL
ncbi:MAG TPA: alpha/beta fold hydrolase [Tepidisphaeraceae bacterium]|nr:alpha/beta fold hydrolase [Tepidisphaeraceae bacterium]